MRPHQGKAVVVVLDCFRRNVPAIDAMTLFAAGAHLAPVEVGMALRALRSHVREHRLSVTLRAQHPLVHAAQRKFRQVVVKLGNAANRFPAQRGVTVRTRQIQRPVRAPRLRVHLPLSLSLGGGAQRQKQKQIDQNGCDQVALTPLVSWITYKTAECLCRKD